MRLLAFVPLVVLAGCSLIGNVVTGSWSSANGLEVEIRMDRSWRGSLPTGAGRVEFTGQWRSKDGKLTLVPLRWTMKSGFADSSVSNSQSAAMNKDIDYALEIIREKRFVLSKDGELDILRDTSRMNDQSMYRVVEK